MKKLDPNTSCQPTETLVFHGLTVLPHLLHSDFTPSDLPFDKMEGPTAQPPLPEQQLTQHYSSISIYYSDSHICWTLRGSYQGDGMNAMT